MKSRFLAICGLLGVFATAVVQAQEIPGQSFHVAPQNLPKPFATAASDNSPKKIARPAGAMPVAPKGFTVSVFADGLLNPRFMAVAENGDVFVSQPDGGKISWLRTGKDGKVVITTYATGFDGCHGVAFHDGALYVADRRAVWRLPYGEQMARTADRKRVTKPATLGRPGGHFTRDIAFDSKGTLFVTIGSRDNLDEDPWPEAAVVTVNGDGTLAPFVSGTRNPVGIAFYPATDNLFVTVNERDGLGDGLVPDYLTHLEKGAFYGWPYAYIGNHPDPGFGAKRPDLVAKAKVPDLLFQAHSAPLGLAFYTGTQFPAAYRGDAFVALHGSWNSGKPTGYKVVHVHFANGKPQDAYENFLTGFWDGRSSPAQVWGRPVGIVMAKDGSLLVSDDVAKVIWRVAYTGN